MTIEDKKRELALDRIQQAEESLEESEYLFDGKKSPIYKMPDGSESR